LFLQCFYLYNELVNFFAVTCAYRLLYEGKPLPSWHPLISGDPESVRKADILIRHGIHERDVIDWFDFILDEDNEV